MVGLLPPLIPPTSFPPHSVFLSVFSLFFPLFILSYPLLSPYFLSPPPSISLLFLHFPFLSHLPPPVLPPHSHSLSPLSPPPPSPSPTSTVVAVGFESPSYTAYEGDGFLSIKVLSNLTVPPDWIVATIIDMDNDSMSGTAVFWLVVHKSRRESAHARPFGGNFALKIVRMREFSSQFLDNQPENRCM